MSLPLEIPTLTTIRLAAPALSSPADTTKLANTTPTFSWAAVPGAISYQIQIAYNSSFTTLVENVSGLLVTNYTPTNSLPTITLYWRVRAHDGSWSAVRSFSFYTFEEYEAVLAPQIALRFNETSGVVATNAGSLGAAQNGTYSNATLGVTGQLGINEAVTWNGTTTVVTIPNGSYDDQLAYTYAFLTNISGAGENSAGYLFTYNGTNFRLQRNAGKWLVSRDASGGAPTSITIEDITTGAWHWIFVTMNWSGDKKHHIYKGQAGVVAEYTYSTQATGGGTLTALTADLLLGNNGAGTRTLDGKMDVFWLFDRVLSTDEMANVTALTTAPPSGNSITLSGSPNEDLTDEIESALSTYTNVEIINGPYVIAHRVIVPSGKHLSGNAELIQNYIDDVDYYGEDMLEVPAGSSGITITGLTFSGLHVSGWTNAQMSAIGIRGTTCSDITVSNCIFRNLVGFSVHNEAGGQRINVIDCEFTNCGNGLNVNASNSEFTGNVFTDSEGIEASGAAITVSNNVFNDVYEIAISLGGDIGGTQLPDCVVENNAIYGSTGHGIIIADGIIGALISNNTIEDCDEIGLLLTSSVQPVTNVRLTLNEIRRSGTIGIYIPNVANMTGTQVDHNLVENSGAAAYGLQNANASVTITDNDFRGSGNSYDVILQPTSNGCTFSSNQYTTILDQR